MWCMDPLCCDCPQPLLRDSHSSNRRPSAELKYHATPQTVRNLLSRVRVHRSCLISSTLRHHHDRSVRSFGARP